MRRKAQPDTLLPMKTTNLPSGYRFRRPVAEEASDIDRLAASSDAALGALPALSEDLIRDFWSRTRFVLDADAWVVEHTRDIVGYAEVWDLNPQRLTAFAIVHPHHTRRGIAAPWRRSSRTEPRRKQMETRGCSQPPSRRMKLPRNCSRRAGTGELVGSGTWRSSSGVGGEVPPHLPASNCGVLIRQGIFRRFTGYSRRPSRTTGITLQPRLKSSLTGVSGAMTSIRPSGPSRSTPMSRSRSYAAAHIPTEPGSTISACCDRIEVEG